MSNLSTAEDQRLVIKRVFKAPVEKVYQAWTDPDKMAKWMSPNERWLTPGLEMEHRVGGKHNITMRHSDGDLFTNVGQYVEIVPNQRIVFTWTWQEGSMGGGETLVTVEFAAVSEGTELTLTHDRIADAEMRGQTSEGWGGCLGMLDAYLTDGKELRAAV